MKYGFASLLNMLLLITVVSAQGDGYRDSIAAIVGDEVITVFDLFQMTRSQEEALRERYSGQELSDRILELRKMAASQRIERELMYAEFQSLEGKIPESMLQERLDRVIISRYGGDRARFEKELFEEGFSLKEFEERIRKSIAVEIIMQEMVFRHINVSNAMIEDYYAEHSEEFSSPEKVHLGLIMLTGDESDPAKTEQRYSMILEKLENGAAFEKLARDYSEGPGADAGGDLGWIETAKANPVFLKAVDSLEPGAIAEPIRDNGAVYILQLKGRKAASEGRLTDEIRTSIRAQLEREMEDERYEELIGELREKYFVKTFFSE